MDFKIAIVIPWFGEELKGGAEQHAWQVAHHLSARGLTVDVLTTCCRGFLTDWTQNYYQPGTSVVGKIRVRRFAVDPRDKQSFDRVVGKMLAMKPQDMVSGRFILSPEEEDIYWNESIRSESLLLALKKDRDYYNYFIFLPYLFPFTQKGVAIVGSKALLQPCLHDECYAYLEKTHEAFCQARALLFISKGEYQLAKRLYGDFIAEKSFVPGAGVEFEDSTIASTPTLEGRYLLSLGRRCAEKNTPMMLEGFCEFQKEFPSDLKLVVAGPGDLGSVDSDKVIDMGLVDQATKASLLAGCVGLVNLSTNESFSRVIFEAWRHDKPVVVHQACEATYTAWLDSDKAGFAVSDTNGWVACLREIAATNVETLKEMGERGHRYCLDLTDWQQVTSRYLQAFEEIHTQDIAKKSVLLVGESESAKLISEWLLSQGVRVESLKQKDNENWQRLAHQKFDAVIATEKIDWFGVNTHWQNTPQLLLPKPQVVSKPIKSLAKEKIDLYSRTARVLVAGLAGHEGALLSIQEAAWQKHKLNLEFEAWREEVIFGDLLLVIDDSLQVDWMVRQNALLDLPLILLSSPLLEKEFDLPSFALEKGELKLVASYAKLALTDCLFQLTLVTQVYKRKLASLPVRSEALFQDSVRATLLRGERTESCDHSNHSGLC